MWGETAESFVKHIKNKEEDTIVAFGGVQVSTYPRSSNDIYLDSFDDTIILVRSL